MNFSGDCGNYKTIITFLGLYEVKMVSLCVFWSVFNEEYPPITEENALTKWASDPANTAWMESKTRDANAPLNLMEKIQLLVLCTFPCTERLPWGLSQVLPSLLIWGSRHCTNFSCRALLSVCCLTNFCVSKIMHSLMWTRASGPDDVIYDDVPRENSDSNTGLQSCFYDSITFTITFTSFLLLFFFFYISC